MGSDLQCRIISYLKNAKTIKQIIQGNLKFSILLYCQKFARFYILTQVPFSSLLSSHTKKKNDFLKNAETIKGEQKKNVLKIQNWNNFLSGNFWQTGQNS